MKVYNSTYWLTSDIEDIVTSCVGALRSLVDDDSLRRKFDRITEVVVKYYSGTYGWVTAHVDETTLERNIIIHIGLPFKKNLQRSDVETLACMSQSCMPDDVLRELCNSMFRNLFLRLFPNDKRSLIHATATHKGIDGYSACMKGESTPVTLRWRDKRVKSEYNEAILRNKRRLLMVMQHKAKQLEYHKTYHTHRAELLDDRLKKKQSQINALSEHIKRLVQE